MEKKFWIFVSSIILITGFGILISQCARWLEVGYWTPYPIRKLIPGNGNLDWNGALGVQKIWEWVIDLPASAIIVGLGALLLFGSLNDQ